MSVIDGFAQLPNGMVKRLIELRIAGEEAQVFWVIFQKTIGWHKKWDKIPLSQFVKATGMVKPSICQLINRLKKKNIILVDKDYSDVSNNGNFATQYRINESYYQWRSVHKQHAAVPIIKKHAAVPVNKQHTANPNSRRAATLELPDNWDISQKMLFFKSFYNALAKWDGTTTSSHGRESTHSQEHKTSNNIAPFFIAFAKILTGVSKTTNKGGSKIPNDPLVKLRHSKEPIQNKPSTKDISSKESGEEVSQLIHFAARECKVTIMGDKTKLLEQLVKIHQPDRVRQAFENYKHYQGIGRADRRFSIGSGIDSFVKKFDTFVDLERVKQRIKDEKRWYQEYREKCSRQNGVGNKEKGENRKRQEEELKKEEVSRYNFRRDFVNHIEAGAREEGITVEELILSDKNSLGKYNMFKRYLQEFELSAC
jgi:phage replication O-like protein O